MNVPAVAAPVTQMTRTVEPAHSSALQKPINAQAHGVMHLVRSASLTLNSNPPHLGNKVDTFA